MPELKSDSVPETKPSFTVAASPFNAVKLELGVVLVIGFFLLFIVSSLIDSPFMQVGLLGGYGAVSMLWLIFRVRRVVATLSSDVSRRII